LRLREVDFLDIVDIRNNQGKEFLAGAGILATLWRTVASHVTIFNSDSPALAFPDDFWERIGIRASRKRDIRVIGSSLKNSDL
jgi:hypothetical protein